MSLRPTSASWFELVVPRNQCEEALEVLAATANGAFEPGMKRAGPGAFESVRETVTQYHRLAEAYGQFWPLPLYPVHGCGASLEAAARDALTSIQHWEARAGASLRRLRELEQELARHRAWEAVLRALQGSRLNLARLSRDGPVLTTVCAVLPANSGTPTVDGLLALMRPLGKGNVLIGLAPEGAQEAFCQALAAHGGQCLALPRWFGHDADRTLPVAVRRREELEAQIRSLPDVLRDEAIRDGLPQAIGVLQRAEWLLASADALDCDRESCRISGWIGESVPASLRRRLRNGGIRGAVRFTRPPSGQAPPVLLRNPRWARPFEPFMELMGLPGTQEADPTSWLALLVPLLFGYMCGDVGHGLVLFGLGLYLQRLTEMGWILAYCGVSSTAFGFLYGEFFGLETWIEPLWLRPLSDPLLVLTVPLVGGAAVLSLALALRATQESWQHSPRGAWGPLVAGLLCYWGCLLAFLDSTALLLVGGGLLLCAVQGLMVKTGFRPYLRSLAELVLGTGELLLHTLSFARVGAFALAHAGLSSAVITLAHQAPNVASGIIIGVAGNILILALEGTVVSIQTTRLVMFEFFMPFFTGKGRGFRRLPLRPAACQRQRGS